MLINATLPEESRVAVVEDGLLNSLDIEVVGHEQTKGNIYKAVVVRVEPGLQAAFVNYGAEKPGFLQIGEIHPSVYSKEVEGKRPRIEDILHRGQELLVQVEKEERGTKGAALTTYLSFPGRYCVLMYGNETRGVSLKIKSDSLRRKLKELMEAAGLSDQMGCIIRTAAGDREPEEVRLDINYLVNIYNSVRTMATEVKAPVKLYQESNLILRSLRDHFTDDIGEVLIDDLKTFREAKEFFDQLMPEYSKLVKLHQEHRPIFSKYQIEEQIQALRENKVNLPSGGSIVIDMTEALVAVDVNSGRSKKDSAIEATALRTNTEAAIEVARQLRLRDIGGLVVIDFIDMMERKNNRVVEQTVHKSLKDDRARITIGRISQFGLLEMSRQRLGSALEEISFQPCPHCEGKGLVKSTESQAVSVIRRIHADIAKGQIDTLTCIVPLDVATYLQNVRRKEIFNLEAKHQASIIIEGKPGIAIDSIEIIIQRREKGSNLQVAAAPVSLFSESSFEATEGVAEIRAEIEEAAEVSAAVSGSTNVKASADNLKTENDNAESSDDGLGDDGADGVDAGDTDGEAQPKKRRRRRRRRSNRSQTDEVATTEGGESAESGSEGTESTDKADKSEPTESSDRSLEKTATETSGEVSAEVSTETSEERTEASAGELGKKRPARRRGRRGQGRRTIESETTQEGMSEGSVVGTADTVASTVVGADSSATQDSDTSSVTIEPAPKKPTRRGRPPKKVEQEVAAANETVSASVEPSMSIETPATEEVKRPARRGRPRKKVEPVNVESATEAVVTASPSKAAETQTAETVESEPKKPARKSQKKVKAPSEKIATKKAVAEKNKTNPDESAPKKESTEPAKPRRGRPRKSSVPANDATLTTSTASESEVKASLDETPTPKKAASKKAAPKKAATPKITPTKVTQETLSSVTVETSDSHVDSTEVKPKRKPGRPRKTPVKVEE